VKLPEETKYYITLLRHGQSIGNANGYHQGQADFPLTETGLAQARALANRWQSEGETFDQIISSPLVRARETAEVIASTLDNALELDELWMERRAGHLEGLHIEEAVERYPRPAFIHPYMPMGETGESQWELFLRAGRAVQDLLMRPPGRYLVVSHGGILNMVLYVILGLTPQANYQGAQFRFRNTSFTKLTYTPEVHRWLLESLNDQHHWHEAEDN